MAPRKYSMVFIPPSFSGFSYTIPDSARRLKIISFFGSDIGAYLAD
jgi:hypothetical protein